MEKPDEPSPIRNILDLLRTPQFILMLVMAVLLTLVWVGMTVSTPETISADFFRQQVDAGNVSELSIADGRVTGRFREPPKAPPSYDRDGTVRTVDRVLPPTFQAFIPPGSEGQRKVEEDLNQYNASAAEDRRVQYQVEPATYWLPYLLLFATLGTMLLIGMFVFWNMRRARSEFMSGGFLGGFNRSPAKRYEADQNPVTFKDVAGLSSVKEDLQEIVDFLSSPDKFRRLGGRIPKGVLLFGPPGTGKTLLARAVAGEAGVPFFSVNGSEFIQMFVGVGASRVRDLFRTAREQSPAIIFVDEIDAVGRQRGAGLGGGHDEREQTLNQILSEMDGFGSSDTVIVMAATNRPDVLDPALLRPGRFDRHVTVDKPTRTARQAIFKVHVRDVPLSADVNLERLAGATAGLTGADIANIVNEAALHAARQNKSVVDMDDFEYSYDKVTFGAKREEVINDYEKQKAAYHEAGHALLGWLSPYTHAIHKATIVPRGRTGGRVQFRPDDEQTNMSEREAWDWLTMSLAGRAAEKLIFDDVNTGASNDLEQATRMARSMVTQWGMSEKIGPVCYKISDEDPFLGREIHQQRQFSEHTLEIIDDEVARILHEAQVRAEDRLRVHQDKLEMLAAALIEREELNEDQIGEILGPRVRQRGRRLREEDTSEASEPSASESPSSSTNGHAVEEANHPENATDAKSEEELKPSDEATASASRFPSS